MKRLIDADRLLQFLRDEAGERKSAMKPTDGGVVRVADHAFLDALEVVAVYVEAAAEQGKAA